MLDWTSEILKGSNLGNVKIHGLVEYLPGSLQLQLALVIMPHAGPPMRHRVSSHPLNLIVMVPELQLLSVYKKTPRETLCGPGRPLGVLGSYTRFRFVYRIVPGQDSLLVFWVPARGSGSCHRIHRIILHVAPAKPEATIGGEFVVRL